MKNNFVIVRLNGGLGNQMFQYATALALSKKLNSLLFLDLSLLHHDKLRNYNLGCFSISGKIIDERIFKNYFNFPLKFIRKFNFLNNIFSDIYFYSEKTFQFDNKIFNLKGNICLDGNWQSEKYFKKISSLIRIEFSLHNSLTIRSEKLLEKIRLTNSISCHVRRSDYVNNRKSNQIHGTCSLEWYKKCFDLILSKTQNPIFYVFSDDLDWTKHNFPKNESFIFCDGLNRNKDFEDLYLMSQCKHNIIANSSFSWWSAWLNSNPNKIVISPKKWFQIDLNLKDLIPQNWITI